MNHAIDEHRPISTIGLTDEQRALGVPEAPILNEGMMGSRLPDSVRGANRGRLSLYQTWGNRNLEPEPERRSFGQPRPGQGQSLNRPNGINNEAGEDYGLY